MIGSPTHGLSIRVTGLVQGVGFRPFVWRIAREEGLTGSVLNDGSGVLAEAFGPQAGLARFLERLQGEAPALARVEHVSSAPLIGKVAPDAFTIAQSLPGAVSTGIVPDAAMCSACRAEIEDKGARRYRYPFTNCTECGPRLTIIEAIPYDRAATSMKVFAMCPACRAEYEDPSDRRFHAQPIACPDCGPRVWLEDPSGHCLEGDPIAKAGAALSQGRILAIRGLGGFHLACDATDPAAVALLRARKHRPDKPLAVMVQDLAAARALAHVSDEAAKALTSPAAPIVLLPMIGGALAQGVAPEQDHIGLMLAYTPLHHLLLSAAARPLVMTSGNLSSEPQAISNDAARARLSGLCDLLLLHDREIVRRVDDSVVQSAPGGPLVLRRARGLAPSPLRLPDGFADTQDVLALGGDLKAAFCLLGAGRAILSEHLGDLEEPQTQGEYLERLADYQRLFAFAPARVALDAHEGYFSSRLGQEAFGALPQVRVQHHHAHLAACLVENGHDPADGKAVGIVLDGTGMGSDGTLWGGEILVGDYTGFERAAHFLPVALPGGDRAAREPWRVAIAHLRAAFGEAWRERCTASGLVTLGAHKGAAMIEQMITRGLNAPLSSSAGRLFDAVAAVLGIAPERQSYEGQCGMTLEALARGAGDETGFYALEREGAGAGAGTVLSWCGLWQGLLEDMARGVSPERLSRRFHNTLIEALSQTAAQAAAEQGLDKVALSGGVMQNAVLRTGLADRLRQRGLTPLMHSQIPASDGGLALGQAAIAACAEVP
ncbi:MAG: carbamoyltransferase HypF [Neomegalonema sp.]|nr:carbamoyltransferase HypF [Neomegalonema sp.]